MKLLLTASSIAFALVAGSAYAADMPLKAPYVPVATWTGCYVNGGFGFGYWKQDEYSEVVSGSTLTQITPSTSTGGDGWLGAVGGGCDYQIGSRFVIGAFGDYDFMSLSGSFQEPYFGYIGNETENHAWAVGARIGYLVTPSVLTYVNGGFTQARFSQINLNTDAIPSVSTGDYIPAHTYGGWFLGGGFEYALSWMPVSGLFWRSEYRYASYSSADLPILTASGAPLTGTTGICDISFGGFCAGFDDHMRTTVQTITSGLVWRFNFGAQ